MKYVCTLLSLAMLFSCQRDKEVVPDEPKAEPLGNLSVKVFDAARWTSANTKGLPAATVTVYLYNSQADYSATLQEPEKPKYAYKSVTDFTGTALFDSLAPGKYYISINEVANATGTIVYQSECRKELRSDGLIWGLTSDTLLQNAGTTLSAQPYALHGNFIWTDLNSDGSIGNGDLQPLPQRSIVIDDNKNASLNLLIGIDSEPVNQQLFAILNGAYKKLSDHAEMQVMADGYMGHSSTAPGGEWALFGNFRFTSQTSLIRSLWSEPWAAIRTCNLFMNDGQYILPTNLSYFINQAKLLRAAAYLRLVTYFGDIPLVTENNLEEFYPSRKPVNTICDYFISDLAGIINDVPEKVISNNYLDKWCGLMILARFHLVKKNYVAALQCINLVINSGKYQLSPSMNDIFQNPVNQEILWIGVPEAGIAFKSYFLNRVIYPSLRYAEVLLLSAETNIRLGNLPDAQTTLNQLQARSSRPAVTLTAENAIEQLGAVIKQEAPLEGYYFASLVRLGLAEKELKLYGYQTHNHVLPIPMEQIVANPNMTQNPGY